MDETPGDDRWLSVADLARERGIARQSMAERVRRLENLGHLTTRPGTGRIKLVNVAAFDRAAGLTVDAVRSANGSGKALEPGPSNDTSEFVLSHEQARRARYDADLKRLELAERTGALTPVAEVREGAIEAISIMRSAFDLAVGDVADQAAVALGVEPRLVRPHLRALERVALEAFVTGVQNRIPGATISHGG